MMSGWPTDRPTDVPWFGSGRSSFDDLFSTLDRFVVELTERSFCSSSDAHSGLCTMQQNRPTTSHTAAPRRTAFSTVENVLWVSLSERVTDWCSQRWRWESRRFDHFDPTTTTTTTNIYSSFCFLIAKAKIQLWKSTRFYFYRLLSTAAAKRVN